MLQQKHISGNCYPWLIAHDDDSGHQIFYNIHDVQTCYRCRIPELVGKRIQACFHGWLILSDDDHTNWFLWNPAVAANSSLLRLPRLLPVESRPMCYLSSPPDAPGSILLLARTDKPNFVFCRLDGKRKSLVWIEMPYAKQLSSITGRDEDKLVFLTCCNGEVYAMAQHSFCVIKIHIVVKKKSVIMCLLPFVNLPKHPDSSGRAIVLVNFLIGSSLELLYISVGIADLTKQKPLHVSLSKLDTSSMVWVEKEDLKDTSLYVEMDGEVFTCAVVSEIGGGYVHILHKSGKTLHSYNVKDKTISMSFLMHYLDLPPSYAALWPMPDPEFRLQSDGKCKAKEDEMVVKVVVQEEEEIEADHVLNLPFHVLMMMLEFCVGVEYLNIRATCKLCHLAAPLINKKVPQRRLKTYSLVSSPWLMVFDKRGGIFTFIDPMFGDNYFIRAKEIVSDGIVVCSGYGWLLLRFGNSDMAFFNPFTSEILKLPAKWMSTKSFCFSAPPNSPDCMVVALSSFDVLFHFVGGEPIWHSLDIGDVPPTYYAEFPTFCGRDVYALRNKEEVGVFREVGNSYVWEVVVDRLPTLGSCSAVEYFLTTCNEHLLLLMVGDFGEAVEVFKLTEELEWEKMDGLGRHAIYVCETLATCLCIAAKTPEMENKIFFTRLHSKNGKGHVLSPINEAWVCILVKMNLQAMANTVTNTNNLSLRSILEKDKLTGSNFLDWERNLMIVLRHERKWYVLEEPLGEAPPANASVAVRNAHKKHSDDLLDVGCLILATMSPDLQTGLINTNAYDMIRQLRDMFQTQART
ncbi:hypothetical protein OSB04_015464 [Centaurea solstitialis]|uniref:KIB1-4 beta-propeller domain-containing protein n=1 Tax=Centaurea solstitialis TaxID=347529 RepID=A0AA38WIS7_9ASTR|nr:hypothetical protein OSB04_015464 [Centaurea solstitialis]